MPRTSAAELAGPENAPQREDALLGHRVEARSGTLPIALHAEEHYRSTLASLATAADTRWVVDERSDKGFTWRRFTNSQHRSPAQGWKIHVSCAAVEAVMMFTRLFPVLLAGRASFKVPATLEGVIMLNGGEAGATQLGKVLTVYPLDDEHACRLAEELDRIWPTSRGPRIPTDATLRPGGAVGLRYGVIDGGCFIVRANGEEQSALRRPDGTLVVDERRDGEAKPPWAPDLPLALVIAAVPAPSAPIIADGRRLSPLALLHGSPRSRVLLAIDLVGLRRVAVKVVRRGVGGDVGGIDAVDRLRHERAMLERLPPGVAPAVHDLFERDADAVLVLDDLAGACLADLSGPEQRRHLPALARRVAQLHAAGIVHRDLKLRNAVLCDAEPKLVDFELSAFVGDDRVLGGGTAGHIPPEGLRGPATVTTDCYALGAAIAGAFLDVEPGTLPEGAGRLIGLLRLRGETKVARLVRDLTRRDPAKRVSAAVAADRLVVAPLARAHSAPGARDARSLERFCVLAPLACASTTRSFRRGSGPLWNVAHSTANSRGDALANGAAGILLGLASIAHVTAPGPLQPAIREGAEWLASSPGLPGVDGLWVGRAGVAVCLGVLGRRLGNEPLVAEALAKMAAAGTHEGENDLYMGNAGIVWGACLLASVLGDPRPLEIAETQARRLLAGLRVEEGVPVWAATPLTGETKPLVGAAHGASGIAVALAAWGRQCGRPEALVVAAEIFRGLFAKARTPDGSRLRRTLGGPVASSGDWCHGAAGYLWAVLCALGDEPALREEIDWAVEAFDTAPRIGATAYCHGLAGQLELWQMLRAVPRHAAHAARRAEEIARVLRVLRQRNEHGSFWASEDPSSINPSLWVGFLGPATALARYAAGRTDPLLSPTWLAALAAPRRNRSDVSSPEEES